ncbi:hypothetical protein U8P76_16810 [Rhizobium johnstonii]|uniref:hypothetical protein n=1 Tax=Rhizobium leguminosarum TaxID=384 RepID=UPI0013C17019|nr:hypothetical protein [Rhizobium leguminosarum]NEH97099.1 hypothetical protein [Rhizobium leguminosarum]NEJ46024.1 hypothetical protein [Rhizobium leguminosarum]NEJ50516.1 hypothetical protein [Rhizobium leguminosarum]WSG94294.1 hypothetical protein U8P76_16810 [Rhizobium johnstonii]
MTAIVMNGTIGLKAAMAGTPYTYGGAERSSAKTGDISAFPQHGCVSTSEFALSGEHLHFLAAILAICSHQSNGDRPAHDQKIHTSRYCRKLSQRLHDDRSLYR